MINAEMEDISVYTAEAELFGSNPAHGDKIRELFSRLAAEKRAHLKALNRISREGMGFRQRKTETARSIEAALRTHAARSEKSAALYSSLLKLINKPEYKEALAGIIAHERGCLTAIKDLQARIKQA